MRKIKGRLTAELLKHTNPKIVGKSPAFPISNFRDLVEQVAKLSYLNKDFLLFFRGQDSDYKNKANFSSFYPTIYRGDHLTQEELDFKFDLLNSCCKTLSDIFRQNKIDGYSELERKRIIQWSILQHYRVTDTPLIDVTQSLRVACSFALLENSQSTGYVYVFGLPYYSNRISYNSEHDLVNVRLLSITPPNALRPYFQEGYMVGTEDITNEYRDKSELDLNNRLIAKFEVPNRKSFWGSDFNEIPPNALYPRGDTIEKICTEIQIEAQRSVSSTIYGKFMLLWSEVEQYLIKRAQKYNRDVHQLRLAFKILIENDENKFGILGELDYLRTFRNKLVHDPSQVTNAEIANNLQSLKHLFNSYK